MMLCRAIPAKRARSCLASSYTRPHSSRATPLSSIESKRNLSDVSASQQLQTLDRRRSICGLLLPKPSRSAFCAIQAFQLTLDSTWRAPGALQWWRECINTAYATDQDSCNVHGDRLISKDDLAGSGGQMRERMKQELREGRVQHNLKRRWFERAIDSYQAVDRGELQLVTLSDIESIAEHTTVSSLYLSLEACDVRNAAADHAASHIGKALFLLDRVEEIRVALLHGGTINGPLPSAIMKANNVKVDQIASIAELQSDDEKEEMLTGITEVAYELASRAHGHIEHARDLAPTVPTEAFPVLRFAHIAASDLDVLEQCQWQLSDPRIAAHRNSGFLRFQAELMYASWKGTY